MRSIFTFITRHPLAALFISLVVTAPFAYYFPKVETANNIDYVTVEGNKEIEFNEAFQDEFGTEELFLITFKQSNIFQAKWLTIIKNITDEIESWTNIEDVYSLTNVDDIIGEEDFFEIKKFLDPIPDSLEGLEAKKKFATSNPIYREMVISGNGQTAAIIVEPVLDDVPDEFRRPLMEKVFELLRVYEEQYGLTFYIVGKTFINLRLGESIVKDMSFFIPVSYVAMVIIAALIFMNIRIALLSFLNILVTLLATFGMMAILGITMNNFTGLAPTIIMALSLASAIHVFSHYKHHQHHLPPKQALIEALMETYKPSLFTILTTGIGFASLTISHIPPIREFGIIAAIGIGLIFFYTFFWLPALMVLVIKKPLPVRKDLHQRMRSWLEKWGEQSNRYAKPLFWINVLVLLVALGLIPRIPVDTHLIDWFREGTDVQINNDFVDANLVPISSFALSLKGEADAFKNPENLNYIEKMQKYLNSRSDIKKTLSFNDFIKDMNESFHNENPEYYRIPESRELVAQYLILYNSDDIEEYINSDYSHARIMVRTVHHGSKAIRKQIGEIRAFVRSNSPPVGLAVRVTGDGAEEIELSRELVDNQIITLIITIVAISILLFLVFMSWKLGFISLLPNLFPVIINFGLMGLLKMPLNSGTALISATVFGIVVDDTIHLLYHYQKERRSGVTIPESIHRAMVVKGAAVITTSVILFCGFIVTLRGTMIPIIQFGVLSSIIMVTALIGDLVFLPAVLNLQKKNS